MGGAVSFVLWRIPSGRALLWTSLSPSPGQVGRPHQEAPAFRKTFLEALAGPGGICLPASPPGLGLARVGPTAAAPPRGVLAGAHAPVLALSSPAPAPTLPAGRGLPPPGEQRLRASPAKALEGACLPLTCTAGWAPVHRPPAGGPPPCPPPPPLGGAACPPQRPQNTEQVDGAGGRPLAAPWSWWPAGRPVQGCGSDAHTLGVSLRQSASLGNQSRSQEPPNKEGAPRGGVACSAASSALPT